MVIQKIGKIMRIKLIKHGDGQKLAQFFGCCPEKISYALNFRRNAMSDRYIRHYAMNVLHSVIL